MDFHLKNKNKGLSRVRSRGSAIIVFILVIVVFMLGGMVGVVFLISNDVIEDPVESSIGTLVAQKLGTDSREVKVSITHREGVYLTGDIIANLNDGLVFYAIFTGGVWRLVDVAKQVSCERLEALGFSGKGLSNCIKKHSSAKTVSEVIEENPGESIDIIGIVSDIDPSTGDFVLSSGGADISVNTNQSNVEEGDVAVVQGIINDGIVIADSVEDVGEEDDDISSSLKKGNSNNNNKDDDDNNGDGDSIDEPQVVEGSAGEVEIKSIFDLNSEGALRLLND